MRRVPLTDDLAEEIIVKIVSLYSMPDCGSAGPLHCELDDGNLDGLLVPWLGWPSYCDASTPAQAEEAMRLAGELCDLLNSLSVEDREDVVGASHVRMWNRHYEEES